MNLESIAKQHIEYIEKMRLYMHYACIYFDEFPNNLPLESQKELDNILSVGFSELKHGGTASFKYPQVVSDVFKHLHFEIVGKAKDTLIIESTDDIKLTSFIDFKQMIFYQTLVMIYARIDSFFNDAIYYACKCQPGVIINQINDKKDKNSDENAKKVGYDLILKMKSYDELLDCLIKDFVYKLSMKSLYERNKFLNEKTKIDIDISIDYLNYIYDGEQIRHCIIHRAGIADTPLISKLRTDKWDIRLQKKIYINNEAILTLSNYSIEYIKKIHKAIADKFGNS